MGNLLAQLESFAIGYAARFVLAVIVRIVPVLWPDF